MSHRGSVRNEFPPTAACPFGTHPFPWNRSRRTGSCCPAYRYLFRTYGSAERKDPDWWSKVRPCLYPDAWAAYPERNHSTLSCCSIASAFPYRLLQLRPFACLHSGNHTYHKRLQLLSDLPASIPCINFRKCRCP